MKIKLLAISLLTLLSANMAFADATAWAGHYHNANNQLELRVRNMGPTFIQFVIIEIGKPDLMDDAYFGAVIDNGGKGSQATVSNDLCGTTLQHDGKTITVSACGEDRTFSLVETK